MSEILTNVVCFNGRANISGSVYDVKKQQIFDDAHPIGDLFVQFPEESTPAELFNHDGITSMWQVVNSFDGAFFRASGGNANPFIESGTFTKQSYQNVYHRHSLPHKHSMKHTHTRGTWEIGGSLIYGGRDLDITSYIKGAFEVTTQASSAAFDYKSGEHYAFINATFVASRNWSGKTSDSLANQTDRDTTAKNDTGDASTANTSYNPTDANIPEGRPDNYTVRIWKRTL